MTVTGARLGSAIRRRAERALPAAVDAADLLCDLLDLPPVEVRLGRLPMSEFGEGLTDADSVAGLYNETVDGRPAEVVLSWQAVGIERDPVGRAREIVAHEIAHHRVVSLGLDDSDDPHGPAFRESAREVAWFARLHDPSETAERAAYWPREPVVPPLSESAVAAQSRAVS